MARTWAYRRPHLRRPRRVLVPSATPTGLALVKVLNEVEEVPETVIRARALRRILNEVEQVPETVVRLLVVPGGGQPVPTIVLLLASSDLALLLASSDLALQLASSDLAVKLVDRDVTLQLT